MNSSAPRTKSAHIEVSHRCNEHCLHCFLPHDAAPLSSSFSSLPSVVHFDTILEKLVSLEFVLLCLTGYEPLLNPRLPDLVAKARERTFFVRIKSNGLALERSLLKELRHAGVGAIDFSLYSADPAEHDRITQTAGSFEKTVTAMEWCAEMKIPFRIGVVLFSPLPDLKKLVALIKHFDVPSIIDPLVRDKFDRCGSVAPLVLSPTEIRQYLKDLLACGYLDPEKLSPRPLKLCRIGEGLYIDYRATYRFCPVSQRHLGSMLDEDAEAMIVRHAAEIRDRVAAERVCNHCNLAPFCHPCYELSWEETGNLCACSPTRKRLALATRAVYEKLYGKR